MNGAFRTVISLLAPLLVMPSAAAQHNGSPVVTVSLAAEGERPVIDGLVDDVVWMNVEAFSALVHPEPNEGLPSTERTELRFLLDRENLYVAVICFDREPQNILVSQRRFLALNTASGITNSDGIGGR